MSFFWSKRYFCILTRSAGPVFGDRAAESLIRITNPDLQVPLRLAIHFPHTMADPVRP